MTMIRGAKRVSALLAVGLMAGGLLGVADVAPAGAAVGIGQIGALTSTTGCSRMTDGTVQCSGYNSSGQNGDGGTSQSVSPVTVQAVGGGGQLSNVTQLSTNSNFACARISNGTAVCWGDNTYGQLGDGSSNNQRFIPVQVKNPAGSGALTGVVSVTTGVYHTCALLSDKTIDCWGYNGYYQLGNGKQIDSSLPVKVLNGTGTAALPAVLGVSAGLYDTCAVISDHTARCWGTNNFGNLGIGGTTGANLFKKFPAPVRNGKNTANLTNVSQISAGPESTCAILASKTIKNEVRCWGSNQFGQLGTGNQTSTNKPAVVKAVTGTKNLQNIVQISTNGGGNGDHTCARTTGKTALCWGSNNYGQLGIGTKGTLAKRPVVVKNSAGSASLSGVTQLLAGVISTCATVSGNQGRCWGYNSSGQFGNGGAHDALRPVVATP
jgi:alpha-tubulin suppressor-like RCC1 family protein